MKMLLLQTLIAAIPFYLAASTAQAGEPGCDGEAKVIVVKCEGEGGEINCVHSGAGDGEEIIIKTCFDGEGSTGCWSGTGAGSVFALAADDADGLNWVSGGDGDEDADHKIRVFTRKLGDAKKGAFLGVTLTSSSNDDGDDAGGVRISGVIDDGPAAKAGLKAGDVVIAVGDDSTVSGMSALTKALGSREPGDDVDVAVLRDGEEVTLSVTLGSRGGIFTNLALNLGGLGEIEDRVQARGHIVIKGDGGEWQVKDLGDLEGIKDLPMNIKMFMPKMGSRSVSITADGDEKIVTISRETDGETLAIERRGDGEITVTRTDEDGEETVDTYADEEALQKADQEAFDVLQDGTENMHVFDFEGLGDGDGAFDFHFAIDDSDELHENIFQWRSQLDDTLGEAREAYQLALEELGSLKEDLHDQHSEKFERFHRLFQEDSDGNSFKFPGSARFEFLAKPKHAFEVRSDGTIEVKIRKGDSELVQLFDDAGDMENREPTLYEKYRKLMDENE